MATLSAIDSKVPDITRPRPRRPALTAIFQPSSVALIGATERPGSVGRSIMQNLLEFPGKLYPVNPTRSSVLGRDAYPNVSAIADAVDLAVIATPAITVPAVVRECAKAGVRGAVIVSAGFRECGRGGAALEQKVIAEARAGDVRIIGPNCMGFAAPAARLNATFFTGSVRPGGIALISQSGALGSAILDWSVEENVGFSAFVSVGSMADVGWADLLDYFGDDPGTKAIALYMESLGDARSFLSAAREVALAKPVIVVKAGRTAQASQAAASHTGSLTGSDDVFDAALRRVGVLRVDTLGEMFDMVETLSSQPRAHGPRLAIVTNAGGPGVLATDALIASGGQLAELSKQTLARLNQILPDAWSEANPVDVLGDATPECYGEALNVVAQDGGCDGVLAILTPQAMSDPTATARRVADVARTSAKPVLASWMGGRSVADGNVTLRAAGVPTFDYPDAAARAFEYMWRHTAALQSLYETPELKPDVINVGAKDLSQMAAAVIDAAGRTGRTLLTEHETKSILALYGIPCTETWVAFGEDEAVRVANKIGYPVVLKLHSETITHKTNVGGVKLGLCDADSVRGAYRQIETDARMCEEDSCGDIVGVTVQPMVELEGACEIILGSSTDSQFGPVLLFGLGGHMVEVIRDRALGLPPLTNTLARRLMEQTKAYAALTGARGTARADLAGLESLVVRFSQLVVEQPRIKEIEMNPVLVRGSKLIALDARAVLHDRSIPDNELPRPAIRPYPRQYVCDWTTRDGAAVTIRPIRPEDEPLMIRFHEGLSEETVHCRYGGLLSLEMRVSHERLARMCFTDYDRQIALVADRVDINGKHEILAVARLVRAHGRREAEFAVVVADRWQHHGLGGKLLNLLVKVARAEGLERVIGNILPENHVMLRMCETAGFTLSRPDDGVEWLAEMTL